MEAITAAGYTPGADGIGIALDPASSEMREADGTYRYSTGTRLTTDEMIERYEPLTTHYPIWSIEDGLGENDWDGWEKLTARLGQRIQLVGDDLFVTNPSIIREGISRKAANSALIKLNQIGTVSETLEAIAVCRAAGFTQFVSHRSGETADTFIADLAVASGCGQIKTVLPPAVNGWPSTTASSSSKPRSRRCLTACRPAASPGSAAPARSRSLAPNRGRAASSNQSRLRRNCSGEVSRAMSPSTSVDSAAQHEQKVVQPFHGSPCDDQVRLGQPEVTRSFAGFEVSLAAAAPAIPPRPARARGSGRPDCRTRHRLHVSSQ